MYIYLIYYKHNSVCLFVCLIDFDDLTPSHEEEYRHIIYPSTQNFPRPCCRSKSRSIGPICQPRGEEIEYLEKVSHALKPPFGNYYC